MTNILLSVILLLSTQGKVFPVERQIAQSPVECASGIGPDEEILWSACGDSADSFSVSQDQGIAVSGNVFTHNHPSPGCWPVSQFDMAWAALANVREIRAVSQYGDRVRVSSVTVVNISKFRTLSSHMDVVNAEARAQLLHDSDPDSCDYLSRTWESMSSQFGFDYEVIIG